jgi:hypothetical protein
MSEIDVAQLNKDKGREGHREREKGECRKKHASPRKKEYACM